jgi:beta-glucosidase
MAAYNKIQIGSGTADYCGQSADLLSTMLRKTFGFKGFVLTDWWELENGQSCNSPDAEKAVAQTAVNAGTDLEMPWALNYSQLEGANLAAQVTTSAQRILTQQYRFNAAVTGKPIGLKASTSTFTPGSGAGQYSVANADHVKLAYQSALESMVLLQNNKNTLPIPSTVKTIGVIGANVPYNLTTTDISSGTVHFATDVRTGDLGSSRVYPDPSKSTGPFDGIKAAAMAKGMTVFTATDASQPADYYVVVAGLTAQDEGEGYTAVGPGGGDRVNFDLDGKASAPIQNPLIQSVIATGKPTVVVLEGGSVINMPWLASAGAVVMAWYPGQDGGHALGDLLLGNANFSGKLPVTWPNSWNDEPTFAGANQTTTMDYYVGYKYFDNKGTMPLFAFGHGLSYTTFSYSELSVPCTTVTKDAVVNVQAKVTNSGPVDGDEISMLFVSYPMTKQRRPKKELKAFHRATIKAGQTLLVTIPLRVEDLKYWDATSHSWQWENGPVQIQVGGSSDNLPLTDSITIMN